jgi:hypothetical protein
MFGSFLKNSMSQLIYGYVLLGLNVLIRAAIFTRWYVDWFTYQMALTISTCNTLLMYAVLGLMLWVYVVLYVHV